MTAGRFRQLSTISWQRFLIWGIAGLSISLLAAIGPYVLADSALAGMGWQGWLTIAVTAAAFLGNALTPLPAEIVFLGGVGVLFLSGVLDETAALAGFSNAGMVTVGVLYIVVTGLQQTGALGWISQHVLGLPKTPGRAMLRLTLPVLGLSAFLNNTPVVAMFIPVVGDWCRKLRLSPSKLMIPLSYSAIFGGICTLIGTSTNLVVNGLLITEAGQRGFRVFDIAVVGLPCAIAGLAYLFLAGRWLLPERKAAISYSDDVRQYTVEMSVPTGSSLAGKTVEQAGLRHLPGLYLAEIVRSQQVIPAVSPKEVLREGDQLIFVGVIDSIVDLHRLRGLQPATDQVFKLDTPRSERTLIEAVVSNTCTLVDQTIRESQFRTRYNAVVLAVARNGERLPGKIGDIQLRPGDTLLLEAHPKFFEQQRISRDFYLVSSIPDSEPMRHEKAPVALVILLVMVGLAGLGWLSMLQAATLAAIAMLVAGCCSPTRALSSVEWSVLLVIAAALGMGKALEASGAAGAIAATLIGFAGDNPWLALAVVYGSTMFLTELITNNAAAALMFPICLSLSQALNVSILPFAVAIMMAASASFATPIGYQTNLMVYGPGGYRFTDFARVGLPLSLLMWGLVVTLTPLFFPF
ncbi:MAG: SLC13 family permease [Leptolyngbya sp. SIO4C1]|nr:SLC13 family permease [Leptolyngbya sp. SIO4C1]